MGFEPAEARKGYIFNPQRNPSLAMPADLPVDRETCAALWDKEADLRDCELEKKYHDTIGADALVVGQKREAEAETPAASDQGPPKKRRKCYQ